MAFRLKHRRAIGRGLAAIVRKEFKSLLKALDNGAPTEEGLHAARKSLKKIRAELRLLQARLGREYTDENKRLRRCAHLLSSLRDADAALKTVSALHDRYPRVVSEGVARAFRRTLRRQRHEIKQHARARVLGAASLLKRASKSVPNEIRSVASKPVVRKGLVRGYRHARKAVRGVSLDSDATEFHFVRRRLKDHWYHVRLFESLQPAARRRATRLRRLEMWLGEDHNLSMLREMVVQAPERFGNARQTALVLGCITKYQRTLRRRALKLGRRAFALKPARFAGVAASWC